MTALFALIYIDGVYTAVLNFKFQFVELFTEMHVTGEQQIASQLSIFVFQQ